MSIVDRVKNICITPSTEWPVIAGEATAPASLLTNYAAPLAAIGAVAGFIGGSIVGRSLPFVGTYRVGVAPGLAMALFTFVMAIVGVAILAVVINVFAPTFGAQKDGSQALKVAVYSYTPAWIAGVLQIFPLLGVLALLGALYGIYLMYLGLPQLMKCPQDKAIGYTLVVVVCAIVLSLIFGAVGAVFTGAGMMASRGFGGAAYNSSAPSGAVQFDKNSTLGKLQALGKQLDANNKKMEAAEKAGDTKGQEAAAMATLGTLLGGGRHVQPVEPATLKQFVPATFAGLPKTDASAEKNGIGGLMASQAEATYSAGSRDVTLTISDSGGASGLVSLASWAGADQEHEDASGSERTYKTNGRLVHETVSKTGGPNEYSIVLGERFVVTAQSSSLDLNTLKAAVSGLSLAKLESMKDVGVQK